ncbi:ABC transporter ATP-binding protein [Bacillus timonensis]|uniref:ABC transporter ATP-binding protein n=1 Tax=Bacillus timonensis TaxID=1033734 RepID=A0A4S3PUC0_9BACI|nr:ABC transporter ATP-binding protein [Bacillus timonensis]THE13248.1 ABC transporter ATP-binding protein [Bacillus timonensis]
MIEIENLSQSYGRNLVLNNVSLRIEAREICALVGRNGAGKSTLINSLLGLLPVKEGIIKINGSIISHKKGTSGKIAYLPEKFMLYPSLTGYENMLFFAKTLSKTANEKRIEELLRSVRLWEDRQVTISNYSKGMLQRLGLAITLYQDSTIIILDEPTSGIDPIGRTEILRILKNLTGKTILLSSHHLDEIKQICTHVALIHNHTIQKFTVAEFSQNQILEELMK